MAPLIPYQTYLIYAILELANAFLICIELYYMSFGLFIMVYIYSQIIIGINHCIFGLLSI